MPWGHAWRQWAGCKGQQRVGVICVHLEVRATRPGLQEETSYTQLWFLGDLWGKPQDRGWG
jgi:hypothetical protein